MNNVLQDLMTEKTEKKQLELELNKMKEQDSTSQKTLENELRSLKNVSEINISELIDKNRK